MEFCQIWRESQILAGHQSIILESAVAILAEVDGSLSSPVFLCPAMRVGSVWMTLESWYQNVHVAVRVDMCTKSVYWTGSGPVVTGRISPAHSVNLCF